MARYWFLHLHNGQKLRLRVTNDTSKRIKGYLVNQEGDEVIKNGAYQFYILSPLDVKTMHELKMDLKYGWLVRK